MGFSPKLAHKAQTDQDWNGYTFGEIRSAVDTALALSLSPPGGQAEYDFWKKQCKSEVDYLLYSFSKLTVRLFLPDGALGIEDVLASSENEKLDQGAKRSFMVSYANTYFYRYINAVEIPKIREIVETYPEVPRTEAVDFYITQLLYLDTVQGNPDVFFTYGDIDGVHAQRIQELGNLSKRIADALEGGDTRGLFESIFLLMTYYVGSNYRRVHAAVLSLLGVEAADFRSMFFQNLDHIIENEGNVRIRAV